MTYYSALHYAAKAEKSATSAANSATAAKVSENKAKASEQVLQNLLPNQSSNAGKYLTTDGTKPSWAEVVSTTITYWD